MIIEDKGIVLYCDASARPNPGKIGIGIHGYIYTKQDIKKSIKVGNYSITNRGYVFSNKLEDSISVSPDSYIDIVISSAEEGSNNKGELSGLSNSLDLILIDGKYIKDVLIYTDSEYVKKGVNEWCEKWEKNNWKRNDGIYVSNMHEWKEVYERIKYIKSIGCNFEVCWVRGHNDDVGNTKADLLSVIGMNRATSTNEFWSNKTISEPKKYWKTEIFKHPFINFKRVYFNSIKSYNIKGQYFQAEPGGAELTIGKRNSETGFSIIKLNEPDNIIEMIRDKQCKVANDSNAIIMMKLDKVYSNDIFPYIETYGEYSLLTNKNNLNLNFLDCQPITIEINPTNLSMRAIEAFNYLEEILDQFINYNDRQDHANNFRIHDITNVFYNVESKIVKKESVNKYTLNDKYTPGNKNIFIDIVEKYNNTDINVSIPYILGIDILPRNNLKKLETENPNVYILTWKESIDVLRYATVISCKSGIGLWSNFYADKIFLSTFINSVKS